MASRIPCLLSIPNLAPILLYNPESRPSNKANPRIPKNPLGTLKTKQEIPRVIFALPHPVLTFNTESRPSLLYNPESRSAYHLYGNFGEKFPSNGTSISLVFLLAPKTGTGLSCTIYKIPVKFSLSLDMKPGTSHPNKWYRKFRSFQ